MAAARSATMFSGPMSSIEAGAPQGLERLLVEAGEDQPRRHPRQGAVQALDRVEPGGVDRDELVRVEDDARVVPGGSSSATRLELGDGGEEQRTVEAVDGHAGRRGAVGLDAKQRAHAVDEDDAGDAPGRPASPRSGRPSRSAGRCRRAWRGTRPGTRRGAGTRATRPCSRPRTAGCRRARPAARWPPAARRPGRSRAAPARARCRRPASSRRRARWSPCARSVPVAGMPPKNGVTMLATPCAISSWFGSWRVLVGQVVGDARAQQRLDGAEQRDGHGRHEQAAARCPSRSRGQTQAPAAPCGMPPKRRADGLDRQLEHARQRRQHDQRDDRAGDARRGAHGAARARRASALPPQQRGRRPRTSRGHERTEPGQAGQRRAPSACGLSVARVTPMRVQPGRRSRPAPCRCAGRAGPSAATARSAPRCRW